MRYFLFISILFLGACGNVGGINLGKYPDPDASPQKFIMCHGYSCSEQSITFFNDREWKNIQRIFRKKSKTAEAERIKISKAIALMEQYMGAALGTNTDLPKAPLTKKSKFELDCIDETVNTTKYLKFLFDDELLKFHVVGRPAYKGFLINGVYPHNSATIQEIKTKNIFVVDSYIYKNGDEPNIRPLENWLKSRVEDVPN